MNSVPCHFFDGKTSARQDAELTLTRGGNIVIAISGVETRRVHPPAEYLIPDRIADTPRYIRLADGASCEVRDNDALEALQASIRDDPKPRAAAWAGLRHDLDRTWRGAAAALVFTAAVLFSVAQWGAPLAGGFIVRGLPPEVEATIGENAIRFLVQFGVLKPSFLNLDRRNELLTTFYGMRDELGVPEATLEFYSAPAFGPNAFALPGARVVLTDEIVKLAGNDEELVAVLAHELGHVIGRHSIRRLAQTSAMFVVWNVVTGDVAAAVSFLGAEQLLALRYSRAFEREADEVAFDYLLRQGIPPTRLGDLLERLEAARGADDSPSWMRSHPGLAERVRNSETAAGRSGPPN